MGTHADWPAQTSQEPNESFLFDTSHAAYRSVQPHVGPMKARILAHLMDRPLTGATNEELAAALNIVLQTVTARCSELDKLKLIFDSGERRPNASGRVGKVWLIADRSGKDATNLQGAGTR